jgi:uncharacterized protein YjbI with pentapeptide repeats
MDLQNVSFADTDLSKANLRGAYLKGADFSRATLTGADLRDAYLVDAKITRSQILSSVIDDKTRLRFSSQDAVPVGNE